ncbi:sigma-70 family RNA polymerase sigma factor [Kordia sp.]|uniref:RNA polymerase sigma factor n=1 Tax=Kordia sp. TaxID=1965332 RepID=UPI0025C63278|nr:sigma-70 family RNA polymerase sigma factor [Kordia sp.]MCH2192641.1 sigma-70 family RNA polymerase sigma factor [Kordia sp.]
MTSTQNDFLSTLSKGKEEDILVFYQKVFPKVSRFIVSNNGRVSDAEDIFQKALLQVIVRYRKEPFAIKTSFENYFFTVCRNLWRRELNSSKLKTHHLDTLENISDVEDSAFAIVEQERYELFSEKLALLSENCGNLLSLFFKRTPYVTIMQKMGYNSENVVRQRIFKCKKRLIELIKKDHRYDDLKDI